MKVIQDSQKEIEKLTAENRKLRDETKQATKEGQDGFGSLIGKVNAANLAQQAFNLTIRAGRAEFEALERMRENAANTQRNVADSQRNFLRNLGSVDAGTQQKSIDQIAVIAERTGVRQEQLYQAAATAMSARGGTSIDDALRSLEIAARFSPESGSEITALTGAMLDAASLTGSNDPRENLGLITAMAQQARVTDLTKVSQNLVPAAIGVKGFGGTAGEASALVTTMTQAMKDATGPQSKTTSINLAEQLAKALPAVQGGTDDRIRAMQADPKLRDAFLARASLSAEAGIPVRDLLTAGTETAKLFEQNISGSPVGRTAQQVAEQFAAGLDRPALQKAANFERRTEQLQESMNLDAFESGDINRIRSRTNALLAASGGSTQGYSFWFDQTANDALETAENVLGQRAQRMRTIGNKYPLIGGGEPTQEAKMLANKLDAVVSELKKIREKQGGTPTVVGGNPESGR